MTKEGYLYKTGTGKPLAEIVKSEGWIFAKMDARYFELDTFRKLMKKFMPKVVKGRIFEYPMKRNDEDGNQG